MQLSNEQNASVIPMVRHSYRKGRPCGTHVQCASRESFSSGLRKNKKGTIHVLLQMPARVNLKHPTPNIWSPFSGIEQFRKNQ